MQLIWRVISWPISIVRISTLGPGVVSRSDGGLSVSRVFLSHFSHDTEPIGALGLMASEEAFPKLKEQA